MTTRRLRTVTNCFVMSLAVADWLVGIFVMPLKVALQIMGTWELGWVLCDIWISLDVLLCTASILSLCAISVDRYLAVTQPLNYSRRRRSKRLALLMILAVWLAALAITCPPIFGWYDPDHHNNKNCRYNSNRGYVVFSAMGSFFIPLAVMLYMYARISCVVAQRHNQLTALDSNDQRSSRLVSNQEESDMERASSECEEGNHLAGRCTSIANVDGIQFTGLHQHHHIHHYHHHHHHNQRHLRSPRYSYCPPTCRDGMNHHQPILPQSSRSSFYSRGSSRPESLALDVASVDIRMQTMSLPLQPTSRVSSFRRESKTAQTLSIVVGGFVACWLPFFIMYLLTPFVDIQPMLMSFLMWLGWINSAINPFIYAFYSPDFRIAFWRLTFRHCSTPKSPPDFSLRHK
ncbi:probable G-protein coupled receptor No18 isoform X3 [Zootermopsis nevadensis]|uniref:5-hydroxytryptamine receptor n=2 Tax=Zootermopsis nevadensis TaxID=136037 RepID=A0A067RFN7_ZOONE|nr:probable G-protein coupled receptor No18 isoform X3 [Zootermopsis nevadensis]KDR18992.1 5-hydroxytryptamine receptor [Zootermopsis nevadensis]